MIRNIQTIIFIDDPTFWGHSFRWQSTGEGVLGQTTSKKFYIPKLHMHSKHTYQNSSTAKLLQNVCLNKAKYDYNKHEKYSALIRNHSWLVQWPQINKPIIPAVLLHLAE